MLNQNYYNMLINSATSNRPKPLFRPNGDTFSPNTNATPPAFNASSLQSSGYSGYIFGTGTVVPTRGDYCLSGDQITAIESTGLSRTYSEVEGGVICTACILFRNKGTEAITIGEIAWCTSVLYTSNNAYGIMIDRTLLDEPITVPAGESAQVNYSIMFRYADG